LLLKSRRTLPEQRLNPALTGAQSQRLLLWPYLIKTKTRTSTVTARFFQHPVEAFALTR
jgi:hypothetical protein